MKGQKYSEEIDFLKDGPWDELYVLTEHWTSDLEFYRDDLRFLHHLIEKYFMWITATENIEMVKEIKKELFELKRKVSDLIEKVHKHRLRLGQMVSDFAKKDAGIIKTEHEHLEEELAVVVKSFRNNRKEVFKITEYIMDSEHLEHILQKGD